MATPHKGEHTKGETGSESWWTLLWCLWRPPSLPGLFPLGFSLFLALEVPRGDHSLKDSQQSVVHHERAPIQELVELFGGTPAGQADFPNSSQIELVRSIRGLCGLLRTRVD